MKALSIKQPYASALANGDKLIEFRSKPTNHRGDLLICSSKSQKGVWLTLGDGRKFAHPVGSMLCLAELVDCRPMRESDKSVFGAPENIDGWYAWVFDANSIDNVEPKDVNGSLGLFDVDDAQIKSLPAGKFWFDCDYRNKSDKEPKDLVDATEYF